MDMRFYWPRDRALQNKYHFYLRSGKINKGNYYTKHHLTSHHKKEGPSILNANNVTLDFIWQGCYVRYFTTRQSFRQHHGKHVSGNA